MGLLAEGAHYAKVEGMDLGLRRTRQTFQLVAGAVFAALILAGCSGVAPGSAPQGSAVATPAPSPTPEAEPPALDTLLSAEVPSLCEHPAGQLEDGVLPGVAEQDGLVMLQPELLDALHSGATESDYATSGEMADGAPFIAAAMYCNRGGVSWPGQIVAWDVDGAILGVFDPSTVTGGDREAIMGVLPADSGFVARWIATNDLDAACCGQLSAENEVTVSADALTPAEAVIHRGEDQVRAVATAAAGGGQDPEVTVADGLYDNLTVAFEKGGAPDVDGVKCADSAESSTSTLVCGVPLASGLSFLIYPSLVGWNDYEIVGYLQELV